MPVYSIAWWPEEEFCIEKVKEFFEDEVCFMVDKRYGEDVYRFPVQTNKELRDKIMEIEEKYAWSTFPISFEFGYYSQDNDTEVCSVKSFRERISTGDFTENLLSRVDASWRETLLCLAYVRIIVDKTSILKPDLEKFSLREVTREPYSESSSPIELKEFDKGEIECDCGRCNFIEEAFYDTNENLVTSVQEAVEDEY